MTDIPRKANEFLVKAEIRQSPGKGLGVFAAEFMKKSTHQTRLRILKKKRLHILSLYQPMKRKHSGYAMLMEVMVKSASILVI